MSHHKSKKSWKVVIPGEDRFDPFALTIHQGDTVNWTNNDSDNHTVVSDDAINNIGPHVNQVIQSGKTISIKFKETGQWVYYCRFHSHLDSFGQPIAPGCGENCDQVSGITTPVFQCCGSAIAGNFGTPMSGVITVLPKKKN